MPLEYEKEIKKILMRNIKNIELTDIKLKNEATKWGVPETIIKCMFETNEMYRISRFVKDPNRQSIHQTLAFEYIKSYVLNKYPKAVCVKLPTTGKNVKFITNGIISSTKNSNAKSIDFELIINSKTIYIAHKYTKESGGAQDHQYEELKRFIQEANSNIDPDVYFVVIADGEYYKKHNRLAALQTIAASKVYITTINNFIDGGLLDTIICDTK